MELESNVLTREVSGQPHERQMIRGCVPSSRDNAIIGFGVGATVVVVFFRPWRATHDQESLQVKFVHTIIRILQFSHNGSCTTIRQHRQFTVAPPPCAQ